MQDPLKVRTRFAPSPTGFQHVGNIRTALFAWLYARKNGGTFILRIEDTDKKREVDGAIEHVMETLTWLGLTWDEGVGVGGPFGPYKQSERLGLYRKYAEELLAAGFAYPDPYTEEEVEAFRKQAEAEKRPFLFRDHRPETFGTWDGTAPLRFKVPEVKRYSWKDEVFGDLSEGEEALDDIILIKGDGYPTYNFAHIVDDIEMEITHVMRGREFISSVPKYLSIYDALKRKPPIFATMPPILGESGTKKLSKRDGAKDILEYRADGYLPEAMVNFLALLGWHPSTDEEVLSVEEILKEFSFERMQKSGARFDEQKLLYLNQQHMRRLTDEAYIEKGNLSASDPKRLLDAVPLLKERAHTFAEAEEMLTGELRCLFEDPTLDPELLVAKSPTKDKEATARHLQELSSLIDGLSDISSPESIKAALMPYADQHPKEFGGRGAVLWPLRYALSGQERSPDPFTLIHILGKEASIARIAAAVSILG